jgi:hypothetical protein
MVDRPPGVSLGTCLLAFFYSILLLSRWENCELLVSRDLGEGRRHGFHGDRRAVYIYFLITLVLVIFLGEALFSFFNDSRKAFLRRWKGDENVHIYILSSLYFYPPRREDIMPRTQSRTYQASKGNGLGAVMDRASVIYMGPKGKGERWKMGKPATNPPPTSTREDSEPVTCPFSRGSPGPGLSPSSPASGPPPRRQCRRRRGRPPTIVPA